MVRRFLNIINEHYGHAGPKFLCYLLANRKTWPQWRETYRTLVALYSERGQSNIADRISQYFASTELCADLAIEALSLDLKKENVVEAIHTIWKRTMQQSGDSNIAFRALEHVLDWAQSNHQQFTNSEFGVWREGQYIAFRPNLLRSVLTRAGWPSETVFRGWRAEGWTQTTPNKLTCDVRIGTRSAKMVKVLLNRLPSQLQSDGGNTGDRGNNAVPS